MTNALWAGVALAHIRKKENDNLSDKKKKWPKMFKLFVFQFRASFFVIFIFTIFRVFSNDYYYMDQNNKYLVADLGEHYICSRLNKSDNELLELSKKES